MYDLDLHVYFIKSLLKFVIAEIKLSAYSFLMSHQGENYCMCVAAFFFCWAIYTEMSWTEICD